MVYTPRAVFPPFPCPLPLPQPRLSPRHPVIANFGAFLQPTLRSFRLSSLRFLFLSTALVPSIPSRYPLFQYLLHSTFPLLSLVRSLSNVSGDNWTLLEIVVETPALASISGAYSGSTWFRDAITITPFIRLSFSHSRKRLSNLCRDEYLENIGSYLSDRRRVLRFVNGFMFKQSWKSIFINKTVSCDWYVQYLPKHICVQCRYTAPSELLFL